MSDIEENVDKVENKSTSSSQQAFSKSKRLATSLWLIYYFYGIVVTIVNLIAPSNFNLTFSVESVPIIVLSFLYINALKYIGIIGVIGVVCTVLREGHPKYFAFMFGFYTLLLLITVIGGVIL